MNISPIAHNINFGRMKRSDAKKLLDTAPNELVKSGYKELIMQEFHNQYFDISSCEKGWKVERTINLPADFPVVEFRGTEFPSFSEAAKAADSYVSITKGVIADREKNADKITDDEFLTTFTVVG